MIAWALIGALALAPADVPMPADPETTAAAEFDRGTRAYAEHDYEQALAAFERAQTLAPHDRVRVNVALCLVELGRTREAVAHLEAALAGTELDEAEREIVRGHLVRLRESLSTLRITGPAGTTVRIDDVDTCTTPCELLVDPGAHEVRAQGMEHAVTTRPGETSVLELPEPRPQSVAPVVTSRPKPAPSRLHPGPMMWVGVATVAVGTAGTLGFGLTARSLHDDYLADPDPTTRDRGLAMRAATNVSIAVLCVGGALVLADLVRAAVRARRGPSHRAARQRALVQRGR